MSGSTVRGWLETTFGFRGRQNLLSWAVAGGLAYYLFILPEQRKEWEHQELVEKHRRLYEEKGMLAAGLQPNLPPGTGVKAPAAAASPTAPAVAAEAPAAPAAAAAGAGGDK